MLLTIGADISGDDLGYLLHKNPARIHSFELPFGHAHVLYPGLSESRTQAALLLNVDPAGIVRSRSGAPDASLRQYVNDRSYAASSFFSVALSRVLGAAMAGRSKERQDFADAPILWDAMITAVPCRGGSELVNRLFGPLGYEIEAKHYNLDDEFPEWAPACAQNAAAYRQPILIPNTCLTSHWHRLHEEPSVMRPSIRNDGQRIPRRQRSGRAEGKRRRKGEVAIKVIKTPDEFRVF